MSHDDDIMRHDMLMDLCEAIEAAPPVVLERLGKCLLTLPLPLDVALTPASDYRSALIAALGGQGLLASAPVTPEIIVDVHAGQG